MGFEDFEKRAVEAVSELRKLKPADTFIVHHDDADGLCSAAVAKTALEREGFQAETFCLEKVYPEVVEDLHKHQGRLIVYSDIGSAHADLISKVNAGRNLTIILDHHHNPPDVADSSVFDLNLERFGFEGDTEFSGATCNYVFSRILNQANVDLAYLALVASREIPVAITGLNKTVLDEAVKNNVVIAQGERLRIAKLGVSVDALFAKLQILGAVGYYEGGPKLGIQACLTGITSEIKAKADEWEERRKKVNRQVLGWLSRHRLKETEHLQWFDSGNMYKGMGTKVIGQFCSFLSYQTRLIKPDKYIVGFMNLEPEVPGWNGRLKQTLVKASIRTPKTLQQIIDAGRSHNAVDLADKATQGFGMADGHKYAANVVLPTDKKGAFLENAEALLLS